MKRIALVAFLSIATVLFSVSAQSGEESESITVIAVGMGVDSDSALKNALRNSVTQAVGGIIDAETMVQNDEVIEDKILSHSGGFVEEYDVIGEPRAQDGLVSIRIEARIRRMNLKKEMEANNIFLVKKIDGQVFTKKIQLEESAAMFDTLLKGFPEKYINVELNGDPYFDDKQNKFAVEITTTLDVEKVNALIKNLIVFLDEALPQPGDVLRKNVTYYNSTGRFDFSLSDKGKYQIFLPVFINNNATMATWKRYFFTEELIQVARKVFYNPMRLTIDLTIDGDISIVKNNYVLPAPFAFVGDNSSFSQAGTVALAPYLNVDIGSSGASHFQPGTSKTTRVYRFDIDAEEVKMIKDVKIGLTR